ncbi:MAG: acetate/propionate family kinase [Christensenellales bacterium]|jgi:acetate kinase
MNILIINAGSSSLKYQLIDMQNERIVAKGIAERIGIEGSKLTHSGDAREKLVVEQSMPSHTDAIRLVLDALVDEKYGVIGSMDEITAVGHRVLHCGEKYCTSMIIDDEVMEAVRDAVPLGPLHNPANIMGIEACQAAMPGVPQVAVFDTAFHQTMPPKAYLYGIDYEYYQRLRIRRYGFHGTSHRYVSRRTAELMGKRPEEVRVITCHLGNGSSIAAVKYGKVVDTTMGLTPLEGLMMGTRSGDLDPAVLQFIMNSDNIGIDEMLDILNKKSGLLGFSGLSSDMRDLDKASREGNKRARWAREMFSYRVMKYVASYAGAMGGVDAIAYTGGIGENDGAVRVESVKGLEFMGVAIDPERNKVRSEEKLLSPDDMPVQVWMVPTNEELVIARDTLELVEAAKGQTDKADPACGV